MYGTTIDLHGLDGLGYTRISDDPRGTRYGVTRQDEDVDELILQLGINVPPERRFKENDLSAWKKNVHRPDFEKTLDLIEKREVQVVALYDIDRYMRQPRQLETLIEMGEKGKGIILVGVYGGIIDLGTAEGQHDARNRVARAAYESHRHSERRKRANIQKAGRGEWEAQNRPFGYGDGKKNDDGTFVTAAAGEPYEPEAAPLRAAVIDILAGKSLRAIVREWNTAGLRTTRGNTWDTHRLRNLIVKPRYAALLVHQGTVFGPGKWTPLIDVDTHHALVRFLNNPERTNNSSWEQKHLGSGLYLCGACGATMQSCVGGAGIPLGYTCRKSKHMFCNAAALDKHVTRVMLDWFARENCQLLINSAVDVTALSTEGLAIDAELEELAEAKNAGGLTLKQVLIMSKPLEDRRAAINTQLAAAASTTAAGTLIDASLTARTAGEDVGRAVADMWLSMSVTQQAHAIREIVTVTVNRATRRGPGFDPDRIDMSRRHP